ncbi:hypothetical protein P153DRAFT_382923 [Dothidotthia symphoricarpi CBS 119687]|uniref:5-formyltetrahydrofolate cyclo-ligase n=1 Tax=Dothidotthia symphoricarpi CBS 119687 TaxID=1392245 RepID=A0A6A6AJQ3_9PLEO|nr:uncharacterized protein P153DRAFT_382923 [Dothidotthia symphoricarpi CBS 119687]KAF2132030.1 hypothetical protein P153DRAFT_382923 [Dothidotthia symphoricarpi CBS 119687]
MTSSPSVEERRRLIWAGVYRKLLQYAVPDSRFHYDFLSFTPDFRGSSSAIDRVAELPSYKSAKTILVLPDNSLEQLRCRALEDGKKVLVATYRLRRGFVLLDPARISDDRYRLAACLDGMEKAGRPVTLAQLRDEGLKVDMCVIGGLVFNERGVTIWEGQSLFEVQWALLQDIGTLDAKTLVVAVAHTCQVVDEAQLGLESITPGKTGEVQCDFVVTSERVIEVDSAVKSTGGVNFDAVDPDAINSIPPLQELKGIRMMEQIMQGEGFGQQKEKAEPKPPSAEEQMGISFVEKLMKEYNF